MNKSYEIEGLKCQGCANTVKEQFGKVAGVESVEVDVDTNTATVSGYFNEQELTDSLKETKYAIK